MSGKRTVFIVLAIIVALFVVGLVATNKSEPPRDGDRCGSACARDASDRPFLRSLFGGAGPKLKLARVNTTCREGRAFVIQAGSQCVVTITADQDRRNAQLRIVREAGTVDFLYEPHPADRPDDYETPDLDTMGSDEKGIVALKNGGTLRFWCRSSGACRVAIK